jgi:hypothetical protein
MPWIHHPACQDGPVSVWRWLKFQLSDIFGSWSRTLERQALYPHDKDDLPF